jgi:hypothetical protein
MAVNKGGAPVGNNNASIGREGRKALEMALEHYPNVPEVIGKTRTLILMWRPIIAKAFEDGDLAAMKEINDRLDGRAAQSILVGGDAENPLSLVLSEISGNTLGPISD